MTIPGMTAGYEHSVNTFLKSFEHKLRINPAGAGHPEDSDRRGILQPA